MIDMFLAGIETTSTSLRWTFLFLLHHPDVQVQILLNFVADATANKLEGLQSLYSLEFLYNETV